MRSSLAAVVVLLSALLSVSAMPQTKAAPRPSPAFAQLFDQYRRGNAGAAIVSFSRWKPARVSAEAHLPPDVKDTRSVAALAMLHTDAGIANGTFGQFAEGTPNYLFLGGWGLENVFEVHSYTAYTIVEELRERAITDHDDALMRFCRNWHLAAIAVCAHAINSRACAGELVDKTEHDFKDDADVYLLLGSMKEPGTMRRHQLEHTPFDVSYGQEARWFFDKALKIDPTLAEARLRKGHVLHVGLNEPDAQPLLERALADARAADDAFVRHLAALFLGELHEDHGELDAAIPYYREAVSVIRAHTASIALGQALIRTGQTAEGLAVGKRMFGREGSGDAPIADPWVLYGAGQYYKVDERLEMMRALVRTR